MTNKDRKNGKSKKTGEKGIRITVVAFQTFIQPPTDESNQAFVMSLTLCQWEEGFVSYTGFPRRRAWDKDLAAHDLLRECSQEKGNNGIRK